MMQKKKGSITNELNKNIGTENEVSFKNSALNSSSSNTDYLASTKKIWGDSKTCTI